YSSARAIAEQMDPCPQLVAASRRLGRLLMQDGDPASAPLILQAARLAESMPESLEYAPTILAQAEAHAADADLGMAVDFARRAVDINGTLEFKCEARLVLADLLLAVGSHDAGRAVAAEAMAAATQLNSPSLLARAHQVSERGTQGEVSGA